MQLIKRHLSHWLLNQRKRGTFNPHRARKVLILRNDKIGDMIVSTPILRELKAAYPELIIDVVASSSNRQVIEGCPHVRRVLQWDRGSAIDGLLTMLRIRRERYDLIFSTANQFSLPYQLRLKLLGARYLVGFNVDKYGTNTGRLGMYHRTVECDRDRHILENYFSALRDFQLGEVDYGYELYGVDAHAHKAQEFVRGLRQRYAGLVCLNYQGSAANRTLCQDDTVALCAELADKYPCHAVVVIYPPNGKAQADAIIDCVRRPNVVASFETANILELAALIRECDIVISPDTSVIHLASAYNKKILGFYVNTDNYRWFYPMCDHFRVLLSRGEHIEKIDRPAALHAVEQLMSA